MNYSPSRRLASWLARRCIRLGAERSLVQIQSPRPSETAGFAAVSFVLGSERELSRGPNGVQTSRRTAQLGCRPTPISGLAEGGGEGQSSRTCSWELPPRQRLRIWPSMGCLRSGSARRWPAASNPFYPRLFLPFVCGRAHRRPWRQRRGTRLPSAQRNLPSSWRTPQTSCRTGSIADRHSYAITRGSNDLRLGPPRLRLVLRRNAGGSCTEGAGVGRPQERVRMPIVQMPSFNSRMVYIHCHVLPPLSDN